MSFQLNKKNILKKRISYRESTSCAEVVKEEEDKQSNGEESNEPPQPLGPGRVVVVVQAGGLVVDTVKDDGDQNDGRGEPHPTHLPVVVRFSSQHHLNVLWEVLVSWGREKCLVYYKCFMI